MKVSMTTKIHDELVKGILSVFGDQVTRIVLYGSEARGTAQPDSDVDIAVFLNGDMSRDKENRLSDIIVDLNLKYDRVFSVIDVNNVVYDKWRSVSPFYQHIDKEGITLWTAA